MTNNWKDCDKLPVVGKRYRLRKTYLDGNNNKTTRENKKVIVTEIEEREGDYLIHYKDDDGITNGLSSISFLGLYYEEIPEDNLQETKEVSEVDKALEELKKNIKLTNYNWLTSIDYKNLKQTAQNLVDALEAEKSAMNVIKDFLKEGTKNMKDFNAKMDEKYPMSKPEPKIDMKEERVDLPNIKLPFAYSFTNASKESVFFGGKEIKSGERIVMTKLSVEPVSIWKDVSESPEEITNIHDTAIPCLVKDALGYTTIATFSVDAFYDWRKPHKAMEQGYLSTKSPIKWCYLHDFINSFEQMQKDIEELKNK